MNNAFSKAFALESIGEIGVLNAETETYNGVTSDELVDYARTVAYKVFHNIKSGYKMSKEMNMRFWECECCGLLLVTYPQDSATDHKCAQCDIAKCEHGGKYMEVTAAYFAKQTGITCIIDGKQHDQQVEAAQLNGYMNEELEMRIEKAWERYRANAEHDVYSPVPTVEFIAGYDALLQEIRPLVGICKQPITLT